jgi:hypothetical protein
MSAYYWEHIKSCLWVSYPIYVNLVILLHIDSSISSHVQYWWNCKFIYSLWPILLFSNMDISTTKMCLDTSTLAKSIMGRRVFILVSYFVILVVFLKASQLSSFPCWYMWCLRHVGGWSSSIYNKINWAFGHALKAKNLISILHNFVLDIMIYS